MVSEELLVILHRLNRADKMRVVQLLVNELAEVEGVESPNSPPSNIENELDAMAADPNIQGEIALINAEFSEAEFDGLADNT
jgi:hypothetical protein